jgi:Na+/serine symporter
LSVDAPQFRVTVVPEAIPVRLVGAVGGCVSTSHAGGVMLTVSLACETLPAASRALTNSPQVTCGITVSVVDSVRTSTDFMNWPSW